MIDIEKCKDGMMQVYVRGIVGNSKNRKECIADAIKEILQDPEKALAQKYMGTKEYSGFYDQREDHRYGYGPKHGSTIFEVGKNHNYVGKISENAIYYLECERDFVPGNDDKRNLGGVINSIESRQFEIEECSAILKKQSVDSHLISK